MRIRLTFALLLAPALTFASAATVLTPPPSAALLLRARPAAWRLPLNAAPSPVGIRFEPETGAAAVETSQRTAQQNSIARELAASSVRTNADGSRHAVLGGLIRSYTVAHVDATGKLVQDCVHSQAEAVERVRAAASGKDGH